jgi:crotonobetainyl-CoA:carnitine CoA-transferase CaiB-like acyl-CoA transferase
VEVVEPDAARGPCSGIRVVDFSTVVSGPLCTQILGDLGADVIKVETPVGDVSRRFPPLRDGLAGFFAAFNRNKRSIVVDLKQDAGRDVARRLCKVADVVVENFRPGVAERLGIGWADLSAANPGLVYVSINGFGPDGPYAELPAYDLVIQGLIGIMPLQGGEASPTLMKSLVADKCAAMTAANAAVAALLHRERAGGRGQKVDVPMLDAFAAYLLPDLMLNHIFQPPLPMPGGVDIYKTWQTADGFVTGILIEDHQFEGFCRAIEREDLLEKEEFGSLVGRILNSGVLYEICDEELAKWTTAEFIERARRFGAPFAPAQSIEDFMGDPQVAHNRTHFDLEDPMGGATRFLRHPARYADSPASLRRHPPRHGEHTDEILSAAGLDANAIEHLRAEGTVK